MEKGFDVGNDFEKQLEFYIDDNKFKYIAYLWKDNNKISIKFAKLLVIM